MSELETALRDSAKNYVNGRWVALTDKGIPVVNPATGETISSVGFSDRGDVDDAISSDPDAFEEWREHPVEERIQPLFEFKQLPE